MILVLVAWILIGFGNFLNYLFNFTFKFNILDFILGLPLFVILGPIGLFALNQP